MSDTERSKARNIAVWVVSALLALAFLGAGGSKLADLTAAGEQFARFGYPAGFAIFIAVCEVAGGIGVLIPRLAGLAAGGLIAIMLGAAYSHLAAGDPIGDAMAPVVLGLLCAYVVWERGLPFGGAAPSSEGAGESQAR